MRENRRLLALTSAIILLPMLCGLLLWARLPETLATHFGADNAPNGFSSKTTAVFGLPLLLLALHWVCVLAGKASAGGGPLGKLVLWIIPATSLFCGLVMYGYALDQRLDVGRMALVFTGLLFTLAGNYMPKLRRNAVIGIRLPTTLADEDNWAKTHRFAGPLWVAGGLLTLALGLLGAAPARWPLATLIALAVAPMLYSLALTKRKEEP